MASFLNEQYIYSSVGASTERRGHTFLIPIIPLCSLHKPRFVRHSAWRSLLREAETPDCRRGSSWQVKLSLPLWNYITILQVVPDHPAAPLWLGSEWRGQICRSGSEQFGLCSGTNGSCINSSLHPQLQNATTAINTVVKNLVLGPEDIILSNSHSYNACNNAIDSAVQRCSADTLALDLRYREGVFINLLHFCSCIKIN